MKLELCPCTNN